MNFVKWFSTKKDKKNNPKNVDAEGRDIKKDFSDVGIDNTRFNWDVYAAQMGFYPTVVGTSSSGNFGNMYGGYFSFQGGSGTYPLYGMHSLVRMYRWMAADADIRWAVDEITNEMTVTNENNNIVDIDLDRLELSDKLKNTILDEFQNIMHLMDFENTAHFHCSNFYTDGRAFYKIDIDKNNVNKGIQKIKLISPFDVVGYFDKNYTSISPEKTDELKMASGYILTENAYNNVQFPGLTRRHNSANGTTEYIAVPEDLLIYQHSGVVDWKFNLPVSYLQFSLKTLNQLRNLKDAMIIYRMTRAPERFVFNVEVGKLQHSKAEQYVKAVADKLQETMEYDPETGSFSDKNKDKLAMYKDWYFPKVQGEGTSVDTLQAGNMTGQIEEIEYLQKALFRQLYIPYSRYFQESTVQFGNDGELERAEIKFYKYIQKIQIQFNGIFYELLKKQLSFKNIISEEDFNKYKTSISFIWGTNNLYKETKETALLRRKGNALSEFDAHEGKYVSKDWIFKNILNLDDDEIRKIEEQMDKELISNSYREQVRNADIRFNKEGQELAMDAETEQWVPKKNLDNKVTKDTDTDDNKEDE